MLVLASTLLLSSMDLPVQGPVPEPRPDVAGQIDNVGTEDKHAGSSDKAEPEIDPKEVAKKEQEEAHAPPPIEREEPVQFAACIAELTAAGVEFAEATPIDDGGGCGIDRPLLIKSLGGGVLLNPPGTMRCRTAINLVRWTHDVVAPMLEQAQPTEALAEVKQASSYICRKRNNAETGKISEHSHGNAVDIAGFTFKSGNTFAIEPRQEDSTLNGAFQRAIASAACLYFSTVLDPGSDKAHETHLHLDTLKRKGGYRYCW